MHSGIWYRRAPPNNRMNPTLLISALINGSTRIVCLAEVLATHPQSGLCEPLGGQPQLALGSDAL
jgi:hypothetical protein